MSTASSETFTLRYHAETDIVSVTRYVRTASITIGPIRGHEMSSDLLSSHCSFHTVLKRSHSFHIQGDF